MANLKDIRPGVFLKNQLFGIGRVQDIFIHSQKIGILFHNNIYRKIGINMIKDYYTVIDEPKKPQSKGE